MRGSTQLSSLRQITLLVDIARMTALIDEANLCLHREALQTSTNDITGSAALVLDLRFHFMCSNLS